VLIRYWDHGYEILVHNPAVHEKDQLRPWLDDIPEWPKSMPFRRQNVGTFFGPSRKSAKMFRAGLYARVSTNDQQTLAMQSRASQFMLRPRGFGQQSGDHLYKNRAFRIRAGWARAGETKD
jgi:hypothetical protein